MAASADLQEGDLLTTSGVDGVYPPGLPVARIDRIERRADSAFARIHCVPLAHVTAARYVLVLAPTGVQAPKPLPSAPADAATGKKKGDKSAAKPDKKEGRAR
jgi:rod shape-determining protein MreC